MQKKYKDNGEKQRAYLERKKARQEEAAEAASERDRCAKFDLRFLGESGFERNAQSCHEEIHIHRQFLRALGQSDVQPGETLRQLAQRTWTALLNSKDIGTWVEAHDAWIPMFNPKTQNFDGGPDYQGYAVPHAMKPDWFETHWIPPKDCTGDEAIDRDRLPILPQINDSGFFSNLAGRIIKPRRIELDPSWT